MRFRNLTSDESKFKIYKNFRDQPNQTGRDVWSAKAFCEVRGQRLPQIMGEEDLEELILERLNHVDCWNQNLPLGLTKNSSNKFRTYFDGSSITFTNWHDSQPTTSGATKCA